MTDHESRTLEDVFRLLDQWRHLPSYRLEPRIAPFFALFLRDILHHRIDTQLHPIVIPEFPLRLGTLLDHGALKPEDRRRQASPDQSVKVDYAAFSKDRTRAFLVELKTDDGSVEPKQKTYLRAAKETGFQALIAGVVDICRASNRKQKYVHLLHWLEQLGFVSVQEELYEKSYRAFGDGTTRAVAGWTNAFKPTADTVRGQGVKIEIVYIKPTKGKADHQDDFTYVYFDNVADYIRDRSELGCMFAHYLGEWKVKAGSADPRKQTVAG